MEQRPKKGRCSSFLSHSKKNMPRFDPLNFSTYVLLS